MRPLDDPVAALGDVVTLLVQIELTLEADPVDFEDRARLLAMCDAAHTLLGSVGATLNDSLAAEMESNEVEVPGVGWLTRETRWSKRWKDEHSRERMLDDLARAVADEVSVNPETGERVQPIRQAAIRAVGLMLDAISVGDVKVAFKRRLGLVPSDYKVEEEAGHKVKIVTPLSQDGRR